MSRVHRLSLFAALLAVGATVGLLSQIASPKRAYDFASPDAEPFLSMGYGGGGSPHFVALKQYASGTAVLETTWNGRVMRSTETSRLSYDELEDILSTIVDAQLYKYDQAVLERDNEALARLEPSARRPRMDAPIFAIEFVLTETDLTTGEERTIRRKILLGEPEDLARRFPAVPQYVALSHLFGIYSHKSQTRERPQ